MNAPQFPANSVAAITSLPAAFPDEPVVPLSIEAYRSLVRSGALANDDPIEFLEGWLVPKMTKGPRHAAAKRRLMRLLAALVQAPYFVDAQEAMSVSDSEPEPDIYVVRGPEQLYNDRHPGAGDVEMVVEISDTTLRRDRGLKKRVYARGNVASYWIVNLVDDCVEVCTQPSGPAESPKYDVQTTFVAGDQIPLLVEGAILGRIAVSDILDS